MWEYEYGVDTTAAPARVWARYADVATWPEWDDGIEKVTLDGPFAAGSTGTLTPRGQGPLPYTLVEAAPDGGFTDVTEMPGGTLLRFAHRIEARDGGARITHRVEIDGPGADELGPTMGAHLTAGIPRTVRALAAAAGGAVRDE